jgi:mRNA interferase RelE/StbE
MKESRYNIFFTREAKRNVEKVDPSIKRVIQKAIESLSVSPAKGKPLAYDLSGLHSLRTSDYRIIYRLKERKLIIIIIAVGHRKEIYKKLKEFLSGL